MHSNFSRQWRIFVARRRRRVVELTNKFRAKLLNRLSHRRVYIYTDSRRHTAASMLLFTGRMKYGKTRCKWSWPATFNAQLFRRYIMYDLHASLRVSYNRVGATLGAGEKYNARKQWNEWYTFFAWSFGRWTDREKKKKKKNRWNTGQTVSNVRIRMMIISRELFSDQLFFLPSFLFLFLFFFVACSLDTFVDRKGCSIFSYHFEGIGRGRCDEFVN